MKTIIFTLFICVQLSSFAQKTNTINYKQRASNYMLIGNISLAASLLCLGGNAATDVPRFDATKANDSYYVKQYNNDYNTYIQTRNELLVIGGISGAIAITSYTFAALNIRKDSKLNRVTGMVTPNKVYLAYRF